MFEAKANRCGFVQFTADSDIRSTSRLSLLGELREALDYDQLVLHYQPKVAADTGELVGVEALVRWNHPTRGVLPPGEFIGLAENTTLIQRLTTVVIDKALAFSCGRLSKGHRLPVAVNVSARSLLDLGFPAAVAAQLTAAELPAELLCLEITESTIMADPDKALSILRELHAMGVQLSVDDFGTGYSSMSYLKILPVDELKIDRSFVAHMTTDHNDEVLVESAIVLGHNLGLSVVAEGVEDEPTFDALKHLGVDVIQGYYLGRPDARREVVPVDGRPGRTRLCLIRRCVTRPQSSRLAYAFLVSQKIVSISAILSSSCWATAGSCWPLAPAAPASFVASQNSVWSSGCASR